MPNYNMMNMPVDSKLILSNAQVATGTVGSTNSFDTKALNCFPQDASLVVLPLTLASGQAIVISIQTDDNASFTSPTTVLSVPNKATAGTEANPTIVPLSNALPFERYVRAAYVVNSGNVTVTSYLTIS